jgi:hypothetical protein
MVAPNEFWLQLHNTVGAYDSEGLTPLQRTENIVDQFHNLSPVAQRELQGEFLRLMGELTKLYARVATAAKEAKFRPAKLRIAEREFVA